METTQKLSRREKLSLIGKYLRPCWGHFAAALLCACLAMVFVLMIQLWFSQPNYRIGTFKIDSFLIRPLISWMKLVQTSECN